MAGQCSTTEPWRQVPSKFNFKIYKIKYKTPNKLGHVLITHDESYFYGLVKFLIFWESYGPRLWLYSNTDDDDDDELFDLASQKQHTFCGERDADRKRAWREIVSKKKKRSLAVGVSFSELLRVFFFFVSSLLS